MDIRIYGVYLPIENKQKLKNMETIRKFEQVKEGDTVSFEENGMIEHGIVSEVKNNTFIVRALRSWDNNGVISYYDAFFNFYKTGTKSHSHYTYGNAIRITVSIN